MARKTSPARPAGSIIVSERRCHRWTEQRRAVFLATLSETANVRKSAAQAQMSLTAAYQLKSRDPDFARAWGQALEIGWSELEMALIRQGLEGTERVETVTDGRTGQLAYIRTIRSFPFAVAMRLYSAHREEALAHRAAQGEGCGMEGGDGAGEGDAAGSTDRANACLDEIAARLAESERRQARAAGRIDGDARDRGGGVDADDERRA